MIQEPTVSMQIGKKDPGRMSRLIGSENKCGTSQLGLTGFVDWDIKHGVNRSRFV